MNVLTRESPDWQWAGFWAAEKRSLAERERRCKIECALAGDREQAAVHAEVEAAYRQSARRYMATWRRGAERAKAGA